MTVHTISEKGWIVIPADMRRKYRLAPGDTVHIVDYGGVLSIIPQKRDVVAEAAGMLRSNKSLTRIAESEHKNEQGS